MKNKELRNKLIKYNEFLQEQSGYYLPCNYVDNYLKTIKKPIDIEKNIMKTKEENPNGLHAKYYIQKITGRKFIGMNFFEVPEYEYETEEVSPENEYFVLKVKGEGDKKHIEACRKAVLKYAEEIKEYLPELSKDLIDKYKF